MTVLDTRTAALVETAPPASPPPMPPPDPNIIDGAAVERIAPGQRRYVTNPYLVHLFGLATALLIAGAGTAWSLYEDSARVDLAFGLFIGLMFVAGHYWRAFWTWDEA